MEFESWNRKNWILLEREREIFVFQFFVVDFEWATWNIFMHSLGWTLGCFMGTERKWNFVSCFLSEWVSSSQVDRNFSISIWKIWDETSYILKTRWKIWLGYFDRDLACIHDLTYWIWHRYDTYLKLITCRSCILFNVLMHWTKILPI